jgi:hypothetical protein
VPSTKEQRKRAYERKKYVKKEYQAIVKQAAEDAAVVAPPETVGETGLTVSEIKAMPLITDPAQIAALAPDALRQQLLVRAEMDKAAAEHKKAEAETGLVLARPEIMRRTNEKAGRLLLNQLDHVLADRGATRFAALAPTADNLKKYVPLSEVENTRKTLAAIPAMRDKKRQEAEDKERAKTHVNGEVLWVCESNPEAPCYAKTFYGASLDVVRRKAAAEPGWIFACPKCRGTRIRLADMREGVAA